VLCPDSRSTDKHGGFQKLSSRNRSHLQRPQIKIVLFEIKERFFTLAPARRMPQGGKKPAPASSLTNFKSIRYREMPGRVPVRRDETPLFKSRKWEIGTSECAVGTDDLIMRASAEKLGGSGAV
jgi:hypothetical protein